MRSFILATALSIIGSLAASAAELTIGAPFTDYAVLQHGMPVPIWGTANAGESVTVSFAGQTHATTAESNGAWRVTLTPLQPSAKGELSVKATSQITVRDVQVGEVWVCAGDATFAREINESRPAQTEIKAKEFPNIRIFRAKATPALEPTSTLQGTWLVPNRESVKTLPALPYLLAKTLHQQNSIPIGIVQLADPEPVSILRGGKLTGSTIESWISEATLRQLPEAAPIFEYYRSNAALRDALLEYESALGDWKLRTGKAFGKELRELENREPDVWYDYLAEMRKAGKAAPTDPPRKPTAESLKLAASRPATLHNSWVAPLSGLAVRGVALNVGMANTPRATQAATLLPALINDWRKAWNRNDLPFVLLQQARASHPNLDPRAVSELRFAQSQTANSTPKTALVPALDLSGNITPEDLPTLAARLSETAQALVTNKPIPCGPVIESVRFESGKAQVRFKKQTLPLAARDGGPIKGFAITERPNRWAYATATIEGDSVVVNHPNVRNPVALRYDWILENGREGNLTDASGLPAIPYRSDDWPAFTNTPQALRPNAVATIQPNDLYPVADPALPRVLLIGDSIMNGYSPFVVEALRGKANVGRLVAFGMIGGNDTSAAAFCEKLKDGDYALIHYNDGLHSLPPRITDEQFGTGLTAMLKHLKTVTPKVIWATTTPAPDRANTLGPESHNGTVITRNDMSKKIADAAGVPVNDLYGVVIGERETLQGFANLHFTSEGSKRMGLQIVRLIETQLAQP
jgi:sialate O-acetylesterase